MQNLIRITHLVCDACGRDDRLDVHRETRTRRKVICDCGYVFLVGAGNWTSVPSWKEKSQMPRVNRKAIEQAIMKEYGRPYYQCIGQPWFTQAVHNRMLALTDPDSKAGVHGERALKRDLLKVAGEAGM